MAPLLERRIVHFRAHPWYSSPVSSENKVAPPVLESSTHVFSDTSFLL